MLQLGRQERSRIHWDTHWDGAGADSGAVAVRSWKGRGRGRIHWDGADADADAVESWERGSHKGT